MNDLTAVIQPWIFQIQAYPGESFGHFLGRFRRANELSRAGLAELLSVPAAIVQAWETPSRRSPPSETQLATLSALSGVSLTYLKQLLPPDTHSIHLSTRLCPSCYGEAPFHHQRWQQAGSDRCKTHSTLLLTACPACQSSFRLPALWEDGCCERCWLPFSQMENRHNQVQ